MKSYKFTIFLIFLSSKLSTKIFFDDFSHVLTIFENDFVNVTMFENNSMFRIDCLVTRFVFVCFCFFLFKFCDFFFRSWKHHVVDLFFSIWFFFFKLFFSLSILVRISIFFSLILLALLILKFSFYTCRLLHCLLVSLYVVINRFCNSFIVQLDIFILDDENFFIDVINNYDDNVLFFSLLEINSSLLLNRRF